MGFEQFPSDLFPIEHICISDSSFTFLKPHFEGRFDPFDCYFVFFLQLRIHIERELFKFDGLCFERADEGRMRMYELYSVRFVKVQLTVDVSDGEYLLVAQAALLLKANRKVLHYLEYITY
jgi:hypothetical protein